MDYKDEKLVEVAVIVMVYMEGEVGQVVMEGVVNMVVVVEE